MCISANQSFFHSHGDRCSINLITIALTVSLSQQHSLSHLIICLRKMRYDSEHLSKALPMNSENPTDNCQKQWHPEIWILWKTGPDFILVSSAWDEGEALWTTWGDLSEHKFILQNSYGVDQGFLIHSHGKEHAFDKVMMLPSDLCF